MRRPLADQVALVTGASSGIGRATALALARAGARLALVARSENKLDHVANEIAQLPGPNNRAAPLVLPTDVASDEAVTALRERVRADLGPIDILVNNAGIGHWSRFVDLPTERIRAVMEVNFFGAILCTKAFLPDMLERGSGTVVFVSSGFGALPFPYTSVYCASKHAINGFAGSLRTEVEPYGIRVLLVMPGVTDTDFFENNDVPADVLSKLLAQRFDSAEKVGDRIVSGVVRGKRRIVLGGLNDIGLRLAALFPGVQARFLSLVGKRVVHRQAPRGRRA